ncbi:hypothetical protein CHT98_28450 (plasmid) [Azospirillum brasilense]|uniref:Uncharacterized protein n=1 Tax=Azospirillum brasilense TaxID=192 RepID=A0A235H5A4_AZOBR|nr:hypothetical protein CHT98_28450 [Azospirillum brasilense]
MPEPPLQPNAQQVAAQALADCGGDRDAAILLLAHLLIQTRRGMCPGFLRLGPPNARSTP